MGDVFSRDVMLLNSLTKELKLGKSTRHSATFLTQGLSYILIFLIK